MERKKPDKYDYAWPVEANKPFTQCQIKRSMDHSQSVNDSLFFKYASSIIQVVSEDKLERMDKSGYPGQQPIPIFQSSQLNCYDIGSKCLGESPASVEQNNYNNVTPNMKKKYPNKQLLVYNFSNFTIFNSTLNQIFKKTTKVAFEQIKSYFNTQDFTKNRKQKNKSSFYSGYTTASTTNEEKIKQKQTQQQIEMKKHQYMEQGALKVKGWIEFKLMINLSTAFKDIVQYHKTNFEKQLFSVSPSLRNDTPLQNFYLTDYKQDQSLSIADRNNVEYSLVYTADHNFQFSQKQLTLKTPQKLPHAEQKAVSPTFSPVYSPRYDFRQNTQESNQSLVEVYKSTAKVISPTTFKNVKKQSFDYKQLQKSNPITPLNPLERRYLCVRTNMYELPILSQAQLKSQKQKPSKDNTVGRDIFMRNEPEATCDMIQTILCDIQTANCLFKDDKSLRGQLSRNFQSSQAYKDQIRESAASYFTSNNDKYSHVIIESSKISTQKNITGSRANFKSQCQKMSLDSQNKKVSSTNFGISVTQTKKNSPKLQNYYFPGKQSPRINVKQQFQPQNSEINRRQKESKEGYFEQVQNIQSFIDVQHREQEKKIIPNITIQQSKVNEIYSTPKQNYNNIMNTPNTKRQMDLNQQIKRDRPPTILNIHSSKDKKPSSPKMNIMLTSPRRMQPNGAIHLGTPHRRIQHQMTSNRQPEKDMYMMSNGYNYISPPNSKPMSPTNMILKGKMQSPHRVDSQQKYTQQLSNNVYQLNNGIQSNRIPINKVYHEIPHKKVSFNGQPIINSPRQMGHDQPRLEAVIKAMPPQSPRMASPSSSNYIQIQPENRHMLIPKRQDSAKKNSFYSPQIQKQYGQKITRSPQIPMQKPMQYQQKIPQQGQQYFLREQSSQIPVKTVNYNNNYYTAGGPPIRQQPLMMPQGNRNVFEQEKKKKMTNERPQSISRQSTERLNIFSIYSPLDSELDVQQRSNQFSRNSSQISRPKSMNEKLHITLRRDK